MATFAKQIFVFLSVIIVATWCIDDQMLVANTYVPYKNVKWKFDDVFIDDQEVRGGGWPLRW